MPRFTPSTLRFALIPLFAFSTLLVTAALFATGCHKDPALVAADNTQSQDQSGDPANANLAPVATNSGTAQQSSNTRESVLPASAQGTDTQSSEQNSAQNSGQYSNPNSNQDTYDPGYGQQPEYTSAQPPPPLPQYEQPPTPGDGYLWTPGYWSWGRNGYFWVPGAWVEAPYQGALWTPGYWGYHNHSYGFYPGYWGQYVGYYGGVDYGFGYIGFGYQGGYWGGGHFNYNRSFNNMRGYNSHYIYDHPVRDYHPSEIRVSYNGGSGGINMRARPAELAAQRQEHTAPMRAQIENQRSAGANRTQFANVNNGHPASFAAARPLSADRNVAAPAALRATNQAVAQHQQQEQRATSQQEQKATQQNQMQTQQHQATQQRQAEQTQQHQVEQRQSTPQRQITPQQTQQRQAAPQQQRQAAPQQQRQAAPQQQRQAAPQQQRQAAPQQQRQAAPQQQRQAAPQQQHQAAPQQQHEAAPQQHNETKPKS